MKTKSILMIATAISLPLTGFAQSPPPPPPAPPSGSPGTPGTPGVPPDSHDKRPKVPVTFLGVETSEVPRVVSEQLGLAKGFGLVVDYVVKDGPAAAGGVQQNDIMKMFNDQILMEPSQLSKLVRSYPEGTNVTLTVMRKGAEMKLPVKLGKREVPARHQMGGGGFEHDFGQMGEQMKAMREQFGDQQQGMIRDAVQRARAEVRRARDEARRAAREFRSFSRDGDVLRRTRIDLDKAQIVYSDEAGEMRVETVDGKQILTAKDPHGRLLFSGPIDNQENRDKMPPEVRKRFDKLEQKDLPVPPVPPEPPEAPEPPVAPTLNVDEDNDNDNDNDDEDTDDEAPAVGVSLQQVSFRPTLQRAGTVIFL